MLQSYNPTVYDRLNDFETARQNISHVNRRLPDLGQIICDYRLETTIGLALLHQHFALTATERLVEKFYDYDNYTQAIPVRLRQGWKVAPYLWKLEHDQWYPIEFCQPSLLPPDFSLARFSDCLQHLAEQLTLLRLTNLLGITVLHRHIIKLQRDELLVEQCDPQARMLRWSGMTSNLVAPTTKLTPTVWQFAHLGTEMVAASCGHCYH